jgi:WD40 repeat protein
MQTNLLLLYFSLCVLFGNSNGIADDDNRHLGDEYTLPDVIEHQTIHPSGPRFTLRFGPPANGFSCKSYERITSFVVSPDSQTIYMIREQRELANRIDARTGEVKTTNALSAFSNQISISPDGKYLIDNAETTRVMKPEDELNNGPGAASSITPDFHFVGGTTMAVSPSGELFRQGLAQIQVSSISEPTKKVNAKYTIPIGYPRSDQSSGTKPEFSADGKTMAVMVVDGQRKEVQVWRLGEETPKAVAKFTVPGEAFQNGKICTSNLALSPDGTRVAVESNGSVYLYDEPFKKQPVEQILAGNTIDKIVFTPRGNSLVWRDVAGVHVWDTGAAMELAHLPNVLAFSFLPNDSKAIAIRRIGNDTCALERINLTPSTAPIFTPQRFPAAWKDLAEGSDDKKYNAIRRLSQPSAFEELKKHLVPPPPIELTLRERTNLERLVKEINDDDWKTRTKARTELTNELSNLDEEKLQTYKTFLRAKIPIANSGTDDSLRIALKSISFPKKVHVDIETQRSIAALKSLILMGTPESRAWLETIASKGDTNRLLTREAREALDRLRSVAPSF